MFVKLQSYRAYRLPGKTPVGKPVPFRMQVKLSTIILKEKDFANEHSLRLVKMQHLSCIQTYIQTDLKFYSVLQQNQTRMFSIALQCPLDTKTATNNHTRHLIGGTM